MKIESINIAKKEMLNVGEKSIETGINKLPTTVTASVNSLGIIGDCIVNTDAHGGLDQAIYIYLIEDYQWWSNQIGEDLSPGQFGENLTVSGLVDKKLLIGDRLKINTLILELTAPRIPCLKLAAKMNDSAFAKKFVKAGRSGFYARVIQEGDITAGDEIEYIKAEGDYAHISDAFVEYTAKEHSRSRLEKVLASPVSKLQRSVFQKYFDEL